MRATVILTSRIEYNGAAHTHSRITLKYTRSRVSASELRANLRGPRFAQLVVRELREMLFDTRELTFQPRV